ncbi:MAG: hypothetical protein AVDCRST_MAG02-2739 [uncultured Rubrobacteraceae bacterium]|uniref:Uncharacterized protein n=1 Tax=uncultured Rubrobacteraceae bacterium TaxID=349277 RepID=A0A6J4R3M1_9ACTN|nr:MAG: hypothetical protein AVDCRST_MAG02-2739 [uncultured Rubrobacteraceae bacterium]
MAVCSHGPLKQTVYASFLSQIGEEVSSAASAGGFDEPYALLNHDVLALDEEGALGDCASSDGPLRRGTDS